MHDRDLMDPNKFQDLWLGGRLTCRQAKRVLASYGIGETSVPLIGGRALAAPDDQPLLFT